MIRRWFNQRRAKWRRLHRPWRTWDPLERAGYRLNLCLLVVSICALLVVTFEMPSLVGMIVAHPQSRRPVAFVVLMVAMVPVAVVTLMLLGRSRFRRRLKASRFLLCIGCGYDLRSLRRIERCPECGREFGPGGAPRVWRERLPNRKRRRTRVPFWPAWLTRGDAR